MLTGFILTIGRTKTEQGEISNRPIYFTTHGKGKRRLALHVEVC